MILLIGFLSRNREGRRDWGQYGKHPVAILFAILYRLMMF